MACLFASKVTVFYTHESGVWNLNRKSKQPTKEREQNEL
jgi:hypothetical protein